LVFVRPWYALGASGSSRGTAQTPASEVLRRPGWFGRGLTIIKRWRHVIINTRCSWLHGDPRGFRSRGHRIHSSGDYKHPPPEGEHRALWIYHKTHSDDPVELEQQLRVAVVRQFVLKMQSLTHSIIACSCGAEHLHALAELPQGDEAVRREVGKCKQKVSHAIRDRLPGSIWSAGGEFKHINDAAHLHNVYRYIRTRQEPGTVVWSHRTVEDWLKDSSIGHWMIDRRRQLVRVVG